MPHPLDYGGPAASLEREVCGNKSGLLIGIILAAIAITTCVRIEWLNHQSGGSLPKTFEGKWRVLAVSERMWREAQSRVTGDATWTTRPLTTDENAMMEAWVKPYQAEGDLREFVRTWGLLQYPVTLFGLLLSLANAVNPRCSRRTRRLATIGVVVFGVAGTFAVMRGYASSILD